MHVVLFLLAVAAGGGAVAAPGLRAPLLVAAAVLFTGAAVVDAIAQLRRDGR